MENKIQWISTRKTKGDEWNTFYKDIMLSKKVKKAAIKLQSDAVCGVFINENFITSATAKLPERVTCNEVTSSLAIGENRILLKLGTRYYQTAGYTAKEIRGCWIAHVALELTVVYEDGEELRIVTDGSWQTGEESDTGIVVESMPVTDLEYNRFWLSASEWFEQKNVEINDTVLAVAGKEYAEYAKNALVPEYVHPIGIYETNMTADELSVRGLPFTSRKRAPGEDRYVIFEFEHLTVGFTQAEISVSEETRITQYYDHHEDPTDFEDFTKVEPYIQGHYQRLHTEQNVKPGEKTVLNLYRRAMRYVKLIISGEVQKVSVSDFAVRACMFPVKKVGWFSSNDKMLNDIWEVGKYTLHIVKQREYESCPRNEMKFFSGDGIVCGLVDYYTFGESELLNSSLSLIYSPGSNGITLNLLDRTTTGLWDYPGWRVVSVYNEYKYHKDINFLKKYFDECALSVEWYASRMNKRDLVYNVQLSDGVWNINPGANEWTDGGYRVGEKAAINSLFYKCLNCMAELADVIGDPRGDSWRELACRVKAAMNQHLWSEEKKAYMDHEFDYISHDGNALAVLFGIADADRAKQALNTIKEELWTPYGSTILNIKTERILAKGGNSVVSPLMCLFEAEARFLHGDAEGALELIDCCWGSMIRKGAKTYWEFAPSDESQWVTRNHGWSSGCTYVISAYVLGIIPSQYGWDKIKFDPKVGTLSSVSGVVPTEKGDIAMQYREEQGKKHYTLAVPKVIAVETELPAEEVEIIYY